MRVAVVCAVLLFAGIAHVAMGVEDDGTKTPETLWEEWKAEMKKDYGSPEEDKRRFEIFKENKKRIDEHNEKYKKGEVTYFMGLTNFADLTSEEFKTRHTGRVNLPKGATGGVV